MAFSRKKEDINNEVDLLPEMRNALRSEINKYKTFQEFLVSVRAISKDNKTVYKYKNEEKEQYEKKFIKPHMKGINDMFIFDKHAIMKTKKEVATGKYELVQTGYFCPRVFWDFVLAEIKKA